MIKPSHIVRAVTFTGVNIVGSICIWVVFVLGSWELNPGSWSDAARGLFATFIFLLMVGALIAACTVDAKKHDDVE